MSYAHIEAESWANVRGSTPRRIAALEAQLDALGDVGAAALPAGFLRELEYLERVTAAMASATWAANSSAPAGGRGPGDQPTGASLKEQVERLRWRLEMLPQGTPTAASPAGLTGFGASAPSRAARRRVDEGRAGNTLTTGRSNTTSVGAVASFLYPKEEAAVAEDEVRALTVEGRLPDELSQFSVLAMAEESTALIFRSWDVEDEEQETRREHFAVLQLSQAAANLRDLSEFIQTQVNQGTELLAEAEDSVASARASVEEGVVLLTDTNSSGSSALGWLPASVGLAVLCSAALQPAGGALFASLLLRGLFAAGAAGITSLGTRRLSQWQNEVLRQMKDQLPSSTLPVPLEQAAMLAATGAEAQRRLLAKLGDKVSWQDFAMSPKARKFGLPIRWRPSDARTGGLAWSTEFRCAVTAERAFRVLQRSSVTGTLDPGCKVIWSRPVDGQEGTFVRYLAFAEGFFNRDFFCACQCGAVPFTDEAPPSSRGRYAVALTSLGAEMLAAGGLPQPGEGIKHGRIYCCGIVATDLEQGGSLIEVFADIDPALPKVASFAVNVSVRMHVLRTARLVRDELCAGQA